MANSKKKAVSTQLRIEKILVTDLVVIGAHGRSGVIHMVLGNTLERVLANAPCPY